MNQLELVDLLHSQATRLVYRGRSNVGHVIDVEHGCEAHQFQKGVDGLWRYCWINVYGNVSGATSFDVVSLPDLRQVLDGAIITQVTHDPMPKVLRWVVVLFLPPTQADESIRAYRKAFDPLADHIEPHITLVHPFVDDIGAGDLESIVRQATATSAPFKVRLEEVTPFPDGYIYLNVKQGNDEIIALRDRLFDSRLQVHKSRLDTFVPHVTIGRATNQAALKRPLNEAKQLDLRLEIEITEVSAYCFDENERRVVAFRVPLMP